MLKSEDYLGKEAWTLVLSKLSTEDKLSCRCVCNSFKKEVDSILEKNQDRVWLRHRDDEYTHYFCYDKDHRISYRDTLYFGKTICIEKLKFVSKLMPSLKILQLDPLDQVYLEDYDDNLPDYCDKNGTAVPITQIFPQVECVILPGATEEDNFVGDLSQVKHLTLFNGVRSKSYLHDARDESLTFPNLDSLEVRKYLNDSYSYIRELPEPSKRFVVPNARIEWCDLPETLEVIQTDLNCEAYTSVCKPYFENLKILENHFGRYYGTYENTKTLMKFLEAHKESLTELSFSADEEVASIKVLVLLLTQFQKLSLEIKTDEQAIELKEIKALAYNLQYFEISFYLWLGTEHRFGSILENLPTGLDNLTIKSDNSDGEINTFIEKILEKVVKGHTKKVTIRGVDDWVDPDYIIEEIVKTKPESVRVEKTNPRVIEEDRTGPGSRTHFFRYVCDILISL